MNKINSSAKMKVSAVNPATAHTRDRTHKQKKQKWTLKLIGIK